MRITPVTVPATGITAAHAQFNIIIPGFNVPDMAGGAMTAQRGYSRSARRGGRRGQQQQETDSSSGSSGPLDAKPERAVGVGTADLAARLSPVDRLTSPLES